MKKQLPEIELLLRLDYPPRLQGALFYIGVGEEEVLLPFVNRGWRVFGFVSDPMNMVRLKASFAQFSDMHWLQALSLDDCCDESCCESDLMLIDGEANVVQAFQRLDFGRLRPNVVACRFVEGRIQLHAALPYHDVVEHARSLGYCAYVFAGGQEQHSSALLAKKEPLICVPYHTIHDGMTANALFFVRDCFLEKFEIALDKYLNEDAEKNDRKFIRLWVIAPGATQSELEEIEARARFYVPMVDKIEYLTKALPAEILENDDPILLFCASEHVPQVFLQRRERVFNIDYRNNWLDGWEWLQLLKYLQPCSKECLADAKERFVGYVNRLRKMGLKKAYVFGTGPSLEKAMSRDWNDGYRIVCNTIVRDEALWRHLAPHFIVAADPIYHFGFTSFARSFRRDLAKCLASSETFFAYPDYCDPIVRRELGEFYSQLLPIPILYPPDRLDIDMTQEFFLPGFNNILTIGLLPLACTLAKEVYFWGFDGRAPNDKLFWSYSEKHSYTEFLPELQRAHPKFFEHSIPKDDPEKYVRQNLGDELDRLLSEAEQRGFTFVMMHKTWTPPLRKRLPIKEDVAPYLEQMMKALGEDNLDLAERSCMEVLISEPLNSTAMRVLGEVYYRRERFEEALRWFMMAVRNDSKNLEAWVWLARLADRFGNKQVASKALRQVVQLSPQHPILTELSHYY
ncbi:MAG: hypothetical protein HPY45_16220 [Anaerolineae bacterium]|nr:hypothetical protein [Anaerolineae bacterium]